MTDKPMTFTRYRRDRLMEIWADCETIPMAEIRETYPEKAMRIEWESMLDRCAERGDAFSRWLLRALPVSLEHGIYRRSKGASLPYGYVLRPNDCDGHAKREAGL